MQSSWCYIVGPYQLYTLNIAEHTYQFQTPSLSSHPQFSVFDEGSDSFGLAILTAAAGWSWRTAGSVNWGGACICLSLEHSPHCSLLSHSRIWPPASFASFHRCALGGLIAGSAFQLYQALGSEHPSDHDSNSSPPCSH